MELEKDKFPKEMWATEYKSCDKIRSVMI
jgi:hypothetical protein